MKRRDFIALLGGATSWPFTAMAQQPAMPVVGFLTSRTAQQAEYLLPSLRAGLKESGYVEGQNVTIDYRYANNRNDLLAFEWLGHLARRNALGEAFDDCRLAHAWLANQHRIVLGAAHQNFHQPQDLVFAANDWIELAIGSQSGQVDAIFFERLEAPFSCWAVDGATAAHFLKSAGEHVAAQAGALRRLGQLVVGIGQQRQQ